MKNIYDQNYIFGEYKMYREYYKAFYSLLSDF